jgi:hypothetical protein
MKYQHHGARRRRALKTALLLACGACILAAAQGAFARPPVQGEIDLDAAKATSSSINAALAAAQEKRVFHPPVRRTGPTVGLGANATQGIVRIVRSQSSPPFAGANRIVLTAPIRMLSNTRLEVDDGITLVYGWQQNGSMFDLGGLTNVTVTHGRPNGATSSGIDRRRFQIDLATGAPRGSSRRAFFLIGTSHWTIQWFHTIQSQTTNSAAVVSHGTLSQSPSYGIYRHHTNTGSPQGYGPNQLTSLSHVFVGDIWTQGGTALRLETDGLASGIHYLYAEGLYGEDGNRTVALTPHCADSDHIVISQVGGISMREGVKLGGTSNEDSRKGGVCSGINAGHPGRFTSTTVQAGCFVAGKTAQDGVPPGSFPDPAPRTTSNAVVASAAPAGTQVSMSAIGYDQTLANFKVAPKGAGVSGLSPCNSQVARAYAGY